MYTKAQQKALFEKWERILEKEGLGDIEKRGMLKIYHDKKLRGKSIYYTQGDNQNTWKHPVKSEAKETYYRLATDFLNYHKFESAKERKIWELHSQGMPVRQIAKAVRQPRNWSQINKKIVQLRRQMLSRTCLP